MKKIIYIFALLFLITFNCYSQNKGYIAVSYGASMPLFNFDSKDISQYYSASELELGGSGYAKPGSMFEISMAYKKPEQQFGISAIIRNQTHEADMQTLSTQLQKDFNGYTVTAESRKWITNALMLGGYVEIPIKKFSLDFRAMLGVVSVSSPEWRINVKGPNGYDWERHRLGSAFSFGFMTGIGCKYNISKEMCLLANVDLFGAAPEFIEIEREKTFRTYKQVIATYNLSAGIGFRL
jgi:hypothetical protein